MIGDTPQPGETPRTEGDPWSFADPDAGWWRGDTERAATDTPTGRPRHPRRRLPQHQPAPAGGTGTLEPPQTDRQRTGEEAEAHAAATRDVAVQLNRTVIDPPVVERDHDRPDPHRYDPLKPPAGYRSRLAPVEPEPHPEPHSQTQAEPQAPAPEQPQPEDQPQAAGPAEAETPAAVTAEVEPEAEERPPAEPDVMVLPEPDDRTRPTVALEKSPPPTVRQIRPTPDQAGNRPTEPVVIRPTEPLPRPTGSPAIDARLEKLENSPFWQDRHEDAIGEIVTDRPHAAPRRIASHRGRSTRRPLSAQVTMITLGLVAAFFAWVSAEPFWLAVGHGDRGYATTTACTGDSVTQRCTGRFAAADGRYTISNVTLLGVEPADREPGSTAPARMVSPDSRQAYLGGTGWLLHLRWLLGFALVLVCGYGIAGATGARRLENARARRTAVLLSLAGPLALLAGFLAAAY